MKDIVSPDKFNKSFHFYINNDLLSNPFLFTLLFTISIYILFIATQFHYLSVIGW